MDFDYEIKNSSKARHLRISIFPNATVVVTKPYRMPSAYAEKFVVSKKDWIARKVYEVQNRKKLPLENAKVNKAKALDFVKNRLEHFNQHYKFAVGRVSAKDQKSLWGSCTSRKNLNFNQRIILLPADQADYIIVHELCHLRHFNHSQDFWKLVSETIPDYKRIRHELKNYSFY